MQCLEGHFTFTTPGAAQQTVAGDLWYLAADELHTLVAAEDSSFLLTIVSQSSKATK